jgi:hypothetical protein
MEPGNQPDSETPTLLASLKAFCFPGGEDAARRVRGVNTTQRGEFCMAPGARWTPFTAEERIDAAESSFCWNARFGGSRLGSYVVTDAFEEGHGRLTVKLGGVLQVKKVVGPDADQGELQRYLSSILMCPPALLNHPSLEWTTASPRTLRVRDRKGPAGATVDLEIDAAGRPGTCRADRPRIAGKETLLTPWAGVCTEFREWEGLHIPSRIEVCWYLDDGPFTYFRGELTSFTVLR